jgi:hypothetical protein
LQDRCSNCFGSRRDASEISAAGDAEGSLKACTGCRVVKYCDKVRVVMDSVAEGHCDID